MNETAVRRHLTEGYCQGNGVDIGSGGEPVVPWAIQVELFDIEARRQGTDWTLRMPIQWRTSVVDLPFKNGVLDFVYSSHLLEDFLDWDPVLSEWIRVLKLNGNLVIMVPCHERFRAAVLRGQVDNLDHKHEASVGELSSACLKFGITPIEDRYTGDNPEDYNIIFVGKKTR